jgi:hypothetical protein
MKLIQKNILVYIEELEELNEIRLKLRNNNPNDDLLFEYMRILAETSRQVKQMLYYYGTNKITIHQTKIGMNENTRWFLTYINHLNKKGFNTRFIYTFSTEDYYMAFWTMLLSDNEAYILEFLTIDFEQFIYYPSELYASTTVYICDALMALWEGDFDKLCEIINNYDNEKPKIARIYKPYFDTFRAFLTKDVKTINKALKISANKAYKENIRQKGNYGTATDFRTCILMKLAKKNGFEVRLSEPHLVPLGLIDYAPLAEYPPIYDLTEFETFFKDCKI